MPLNVKRFLASIFLVVFSFTILNAQTAPTSGEVMRGRISKAKAFIAVKNYNAAIYELENIRRETSDQTVHGVLNVLLVNCYLEQGDYKRAQDFLATLFNDIKANKTERGGKLLHLGGAGYQRRTQSIRPLQGIRFVGFRPQSARPKRRPIWRKCVKRSKK